MAKRFQRTQEDFTCCACGTFVKGNGYTDHCPKCLTSKHVDIFPGDRAAGCGGIMDPVSAEPDPKKGFVITHRCRKCGAVRRNKAAKDDDSGLLIALTVSGR